MGVAILSLLIILGGVVLSFRPKSSRWGLNSMAAFRWWLISILVMATGWGALFNIVAASPPETMLHQGWVIAITLVWAIAVAWSCAFLPIESSSAT